MPLAYLQLFLYVAHATKTLPTTGRTGNNNKDLRGRGPLHHHTSITDNLNIHSTFNKKGFVDGLIFCGSLADFFCEEQC